MNGKSANLDLLRAVAVTFVVASHIPHYVPWPALPFSFDTLGRFGVALFFVHTTLVLMQSLERDPGAGGFYVRRIFRIYPLSVVVVLITTALFLVGGRQLTWASVASNLLLLTNITGHVATPTPLWTLPYEVQMYLVLPALYALTRTSHAAYKVAGLWLVAVAVAASGIAPALVFVPCFLGGILAYTLRLHRRRFPPSVLFAAVALGALLLPSLVARGAPETPLFWCACLAVGLVIPHCREFQPGLLATGAELVARYSYGVYITHVYAMSLALPASWPVFVILLPGLAVLVYHVIERPGISLGSRLAQRMEAPKIQSPAVAEGSR